MSLETLLIIVVLVILFGGGGWWYGPWRRRGELRGLHGAV